MKEAYDYMNTLLDNGAATGFRRVEENGSSWYEIAGDSRHESFAKCPRCGEMVDEDFYVENGMCEGCYVLSHTCAYCGKKSKEELKPMPDGEYYCPECTIESMERRINYVAKRLHALRKRLATEPESIKSEFPHDYVTQSGRAFGTMTGMSTKIAGLLAVLEGK